jgi:hypothetical protein
MDRSGGRVMKYFGIKTPPSETQYPYICWIADSEYAAWVSFFNTHAHRLPLDEAIRAYEAIGYKCVALNVSEALK